MFMFREITKRAILMTVLVLSLGVAAGAQNVGFRLSDDRSGFVYLSDEVPDAVLEIRYFSTYNFVGTRIDGYEAPVALMTKEAAAALRRVSDYVMSKGYRLKIFDAYRPRKAVEHFMRWGRDYSDTLMRFCFYPDKDKRNLFREGYISSRSAHSRGSTVDLTLLDMKTGQEVDMGSPFDLLGEISHPYSNAVSQEQKKNRMILREAMTRFGFRPISTEWWHFTLVGEPYPDTHFTFPVK